MSTLDRALHEIYSNMEVKKGGVNWNESVLGYFSWYYAENMLYLIRHNDCGGLHLVVAHNPVDAMMKVANKISVKHNE